MTVLTSISPAHVLGDIQHKATKSWADSGFSVYSLNAQQEIDILKDKYPFVKFIPDTRCLINKELYGNYYISISSFFDFGQTLVDEVIILTNSDIQLKYNKPVFDKINKVIIDRGFVIGKRFNYTNDYPDARIEGAGVDFFAIHRECLACLPRTYEFVMGQCWWDYWLPTVIANLKFRTYKLEQPVLYHKKHALQWSTKAWHDLSLLFVKDTGYILGNATPQQVSLQIHNDFYYKAFRI